MKKSTIITDTDRIRISICKNVRIRIVRCGYRSDTDSKKLLPAHLWKILPMNSRTLLVCRMVWTYEFCCCSTLPYVRSRYSSQQTAEVITSRVAGVVSEKFQQLTSSFRRQPVQWRQIIMTAIMSFYRKYKCGSAKPEVIISCLEWFLE